MCSSDLTSVTITGSLSATEDLLYGSGSFRISKNGSTFSSSIALTGSFSMKGSGSNIMNVAGLYSNLLSVQDDSFSGSYSSSIFSVNDIMGLPVLDTFYDSSVRMYNYPDAIFEKSGSSIYLGTNYGTESRAVVRNNFVIDKGFGAQYTMLQVSGSTTEIGRAHV